MPAACNNPSNVDKYPLLFSRDISFRQMPSNLLLHEVAVLTGVISALASEQFAARRGKTNSCIDGIHHLLCICQALPFGR